jgi:formylglycine-generating enzyme required for sulfatase activity
MRKHATTRGAAALALLLVVPFARDASATRAHSTPWPDAPSFRVPARGAQSLRAPLEGRVRLTQGTFVMGSTTTEMFDALKICRSPTASARKQEMLGAFNCEDNGSLEVRSEGYAHEVTLPAFDIDRTEVRVADYERCVAVGVCTAPGFAPGDARFDRADFPVTLVRWEDADRYCRWAHGRLPTEAEWEYAARGVRRRIFPWGDTYNPHLANHGALAHDTTDASDGFATLAPVGSYPDGATPEGVLDLAGNVAEWVEDFVGDPDSQGFGYSPLPATDPRGPPTGVFHVVRGGSYATGAAWLRGAARSSQLLPRSAAVGFRCVADAS